MGHSLPTLPSSLSVIMNVNKQQPVTNLRKYLDKIFQTASCWFHCSRCLILHSDGCTGQIKRDWRQRRVTSLVSERGPAMLWCVSRASFVTLFGDSSVLITAGETALAQRLFHFQRFNTHVDFSWENLSCQWTPATCYAGLTAVGLRTALPPPSSGFRTYRAPLCQYLQVSSSRTTNTIKKYTAGGGLVFSTAE